MTHSRACRIEGAPMWRRMVVGGCALVAVLCLSGAAVRSHAPVRSSTGVAPRLLMAPDVRSSSSPSNPACTAPTADPNGVVHTYPWYHCYSPQQLRAAYGVDQVANLGAGQTIVLLD